MKKGHKKARRLSRPSKKTKSLSLFKVNQQLTLKSILLRAVRETGCG